MQVINFIYYNSLLCNVGTCHEMANDDIVTVASNVGVLSGKHMKLFSTGNVSSSVRCWLNDKLAAHIFLLLIIKYKHYWNAYILQISITQSAANNFLG